ncbi:hypothetical protein BSKO_12735 [Bryopsis sp. KO-2023]|nr:hypothetical protein BSKO_12735 [Bryopsis sp. KO-2023]
MLRRFPGKISALVLIWITFLGEVLAKDRSLLGAETILSQSDLKLFGVPLDAKLLLQSESDCGYPPPTDHAAKLALKCRFVVEARACLKVNETVPLYVGENCSGQQCTLIYKRGPSSCFFNNHGIEIDVKNASRAETCGFAPEDSSWLKPGDNPFAHPSSNDKVGCVSSTPAGVKSEMWAPCDGGEPRLRVRYTFSKEMPDEPYTCFSIPTCMNKVPRSILVCYSENKGETSSVSLAAENHGVMLKSLLWAAVLYLFAMFFVVGMA